MSSQPPPPPPAAGWYPSPASDTLDQFWDGQAWTRETRIPPAPRATTAPLPQDYLAPHRADRDVMGSGGWAAWLALVIGPLVALIGVLSGSTGRDAATTIALIQTAVLLVLFVIDADALRRGGSVRRSFLLAVVLGWLYYIARVLVVRRPSSVGMLAAAVGAFLASGYLLSVTDRGSWSLTPTTTEGPRPGSKPVFVGDDFNRGLSLNISQQGGETLTVTCPRTVLLRGDQIQCTAIRERGGSPLLYVVTRLRNETITWFQVAP